ncbi:MAG: NIPSNAP family protein [Sphingobium sp.]|uniref:NIPSNAP family protein n=1 Tax=Sphingobium sp. TaxID=1912891 RepID=UPI0029BA8833|nr:NIPSNAP family protein [Sphingobium sp.]MDX3911539.1 NIPSNAP family protein [Sphingobium sp.]
MIYEVRLYTIVPGRLDVALERFEHHLPALFADHGINNVGRWIVTAGPSGPMFVYMMAYATLADRETQWALFYSDPRWPQIRLQTQGDEEATERFEIFFMASNPVWPGMAAREEEPLAGVFDLVLSESALGRGGAVNAFLADSYLPAVQRAGGSLFLVADLLTGASLPRVALMLHWSDAAARREGWLRIQKDDVLNGAIAAARRSFGRALLGRSDIYVLEPTAFALPTLNHGQT